LASFVSKVGRKEKKKWGGTASDGGGRNSDDLDVLAWKKSGKRRGEALRWTRGLRGFTWSVLFREPKRAKEDSCNKRKKKRDSAGGRKIFVFLWEREFREKDSKKGSCGQKKKKTCTARWGNLNFKETRIEGRGGTSARKVSASTLSREKGEFG